MSAFRTTVERDFEASPPAVFQAFLRAISATPRMNVVRSDEGAGVIEAKTGISLMSWGENVRVTLRGSVTGGTHAVVGSRLKMQLVDWGRNKKNVERLLAAVSTELERGPSSGQGIEIPPPPPPR